MATNPVLTKHGSYRKRKKKQSSTRLPPNLPPEIITDILSRLPIKCLARFSCVSKPWRSLISGTHLNKKHFLHMSTPTGRHCFKTHKLIFVCVKSKVSLKLCSVYSLFINEPNVVGFKHPKQRRPRCLVDKKIIGVCNGLVCYRTVPSGIRLWNPLTQETRNLPEIQFQWFGRCVFGFGYDQCIDDYKVVAICYIGGVSFVGTEVKVYTLRTGSWRRIEESPYGVPPCYDQCGVFVSGVLHWLVKYEDGSSSDHSKDSRWKIVGFDLASESFREIPHPICEEGNNNNIVCCYQYMWVLGGKLSVIFQDRCSHADVWVMNKYGARKSWNKLFRIPYLTNVDVTSTGFPYKPLCYSKDNELLLEFMDDLFLYNSNDNTFRRPKILNFNDYRDVNVYVESLVALNPEDRIVRKSLAKVKSKVN